MNKPLVVTALLDAETMAMVEHAASTHGSSVEAFAASAIREAAFYESDAFRAFIEEGDRDIAEGRVYTAEQMDAWFADRVAVARDKARAKGAA